MNKLDKKYYNKVMQSYIDLFGVRPPVTGSIYDPLSVEYVEWIEKAIKDNKAIDLADYYEEDQEY